MPGIWQAPNYKVWRFTPCGELAWNVKALVALNIDSGDGAGDVV